MKRLSRTPTVEGVGYALLAFGMWGFLPLYWKLLKHVPADVVLGHRIVWSAVFLGALVAWHGQFGLAVRQLGSRDTWRWLLPSTITIGANWYLYIWAVNAGYVLETSLGYFLNPLVNVVLGLLFLGERLRPRQQVAVALVVISVANLLWAYGNLPWIALGLAISFGMYGLFKKKTMSDPLVGVTDETWLLAPIALGWVLTRAQPLHSTRDGLLLALGGVCTALPLLFFGMAAKRLKLSTVGLMQYLAPTCQFLLAVFAFREPFTRSHLLSFFLIWIALAIYTWDLLDKSRAHGPPG